MKISALCILAVSATFALTACTRTAPQAASNAPTGSGYEELAGPVPPSFSEAEKWNKSDICPEGTQLSPLTRYTYGPGERNYGFQHYYGRACNFVTQRGSEVSERKLASPKAEASASVVLVPHGPFIWWYENGKRMSAGSFDHGTLATDWSRWEPDGSLAAK